MRDLKNVLHASIANLTHSLVATLASVPSSMGSVNVLRDGLESIVLRHSAIRLRTESIGNRDKTENNANVKMDGEVSTVMCAKPTGLARSSLYPSKTPMIYPLKATLELRI